MTDARIEDHYPDQPRAREYVAQAQAFLADADSSGIGRESRALIYHGAAMACCDAILLKSGKRVAGSDGGHTLRLREAMEILPGANDELLHSLEALMEERHGASYEALPVAEASIEDGRRGAQELFERTREYVG